MITVWRFVFAVLLVVVGLHYLLSLTHQGYRNFATIQNIKAQLAGQDASNRLDTKIPEEYYIPQSCPESATTTVYVDLPPKVVTTSIYIMPSPSPKPKLANATFVILARNSDVDGISKSIKDLEDRFNKRFGYPYVFLNEEPFTDQFKKRVRVLSDSKMEFETIPHDHWYQPDWIDEEKAKVERKKMENAGIIYGGSVSYRNMCRFNSGYFFHHPALQKYKWYWRVEPDVQFSCDITEDPFVYMEQNNKVYGWTIALLEISQTVPTLWDSVRSFVDKYPQHIAKDNALGFISDNNGDNYNFCHFWSNFEIADLDFWRGQAYNDFFTHLDQAGGFYYERWGDAPVHSIAAALLLKKDQIHWFKEIGYFHHPNHNCPVDEKVREEKKCSCNPSHAFAYTQWSCNKQFDRIF